MADQCPVCHNSTVLNGYCLRCKKAVTPVAPSAPRPAQDPPNPSTHRTTLSPTTQGTPAAPTGGPLIPQNPTGGSLIPQNPTGGSLIPQNPTGGSLIPQNQSTQPTPPLTIYSPPPGPVVNIPQQPAIQLYDWANYQWPRGNKAGLPFVEGTVTNIDGPHAAQSQPSVWKQVFASWGLSKISPWLASGGYMMGKKDFHVWNCRMDLDPKYQAANGGAQEASVLVLHNQPSNPFQLGDTIAVWGKVSKEGNLVAELVYIYNTRSWIRFKK